MHPLGGYAAKADASVFVFGFQKQTARMHKMPLRPKAQDVRVASMTARLLVYDSTPGTHSVALSCHTRFHHVHHDVHV